MDSCCGLDCSFLKWEDPKKTGTFFLAGNLLFLSLCFYTLPSVLSLFALFVCLVGIGFNVILGKQESDTEQYEYVSPECVQKVVIGAYTQLTKVVATFTEAVQKDISKLVKPGLGLLAVATLASVLSDFALLWLAFIIVFTVPKGYSIKKDQIDGVLKTATDKGGEVLNTVIQKVPKYSDLKLD